MPKTFFNNNNNNNIIIIIIIIIIISINLELQQFLQNNLQLLSQ